MVEIKPVAWTSKKGLRHLATMGFLTVGKREDRERKMPLYGPEAADEISRLRQLLSEAEKREKEATVLDADKIAKALTGHIAGTCCHKTGAVNEDPKCECRILAAAAVSALQSEER